MAKRKLEEFDVSELKESSSATVHGVILELSPVKSSRKNSDVKYFEGKLSDGVKVARLVSFEPCLRTDMEKHRGKGDSVSLVNCSVKECRSGGGFEVMASKRSKVYSSPKKFRLDELERSSELSELCKLEDIDDVAVHQKVVIKGKVTVVKSAEQVESNSAGRKFCKQDCAIADQSGAYRVVLWEEAVDTLEVGTSYRITEVAVKMYSGKKYFTLTDNSEVEVIGDIGEVVEGSVDSGMCRGKFVVGEIVGVVSCEEYFGCMSCRAKVAECNDVIGQCGKCGMKQKLSRCSKSCAARLLVEDEKGGKMKVSAFNEVVGSIVSGTSGDSIDIKLLSAPKKKFIINAQDIVTSVQEV